MKTFGLYRTMTIISLIGGIILHYLLLIINLGNGFNSSFFPEDKTAFALSNPDFNGKNQQTYVLEETSNMEKSLHPKWWLNSGGRLIIDHGRAKTLEGSLFSFSRWRLDYKRVNPIDTDDGYHPQNLFRLVTKSKWQNFEQEVYARILTIQKSPSPNRNLSNGIALMSRYQDAENLYYTIIRVDGAIAIKKKQDGVYYTLAYLPYFTGPPYDRYTNPNLLPEKTWIGLKSEITNNPDGSVQIKVFLDFTMTGQWMQVLTVKDDGREYGPPIRNEGHAGIRTDFMDVEFENFNIKKVDTP